jgi:hypothetical protein
MTAVETGDVGKKPIRERESTLLSPGYTPQSGSSVEEGHCPGRGCGCYSASESHRERRMQTFRTPGFIHGEVQFRARGKGFGSFRLRCGRPEGGPSKPARRPL